MNKKVGIIVGVLIVLLLLGGGGYMVMSKKGAAGPTPAVGQDSMVVGTLSPEDIGLELKPTSDGKKLRILVSKVQDIKRLDYEVTYEADIPASEQVEGEDAETRTTRGFSGEADIKSGESKYESKDFDLGSCSRNICRYDTGVEEIKILMKVTKNDGKVYQVEDQVKI
jgi:hypothetical protein